MRMKNIYLRIGGIRFHFESDHELTAEESLASFFCIDKNVSDVHIRVIHDASGQCIPAGTYLGDDLLLDYYRHDGRLLCLTKGGQGKYLSCCASDSTFRELVCWLAFPPGHSSVTLGMILRMIPMRQLLLQRGILFFHASQVALGGTGILFTAPSQTGKTTQAKLWQRYRDARIICNDRTLTDGVNTYGYPVDGSEPVLSGESCALGAVVVLEQAPENRVRRLRAREAMPRLMPQMVMDVWNPDARAAAAELLLELMARVPVYLLSCTPDEGAVACQEQQLRMDGVIFNE